MKPAEPVIRRVWGVFVILSAQSFFHYSPVHNLPQGLQVRGPAILIVKVIGVLPNIESQKRTRAMGDGVIGARVLGDAQLPHLVRLQPNPTAAEEGSTFGDELVLEGVEASPLFDDLRNNNRFLDFGFAYARNDSGGPELGEV